MIARVTLELALGKEFDYLIPDGLADEVEVGTPGQGRPSPIARSWAA